MIDLSKEFDKLKIFRDNQDKIISDFKKFIKYSEIVPDEISTQLFVNISRDSDDKEKSYHLPCKRKHLLKFIHSDKVKYLPISDLEKEKIKSCEVEIISKSLNITLSLQLLRKNLEKESFKIICDKLKLKESDIRYITDNIEDKIPEISVELKSFISYYSSTVSLKSAILTIIYSIVNFYRSFIMLYWKNISHKYIIVTTLRNKEDENSKMMVEEYYIDYLIYKEYLKNDKITIGEIITLSNNSKFEIILKQCKNSTPFIYQFLFNSSIYEYPNMSDFENLLNLEYSRFKVENNI